MKIEKYDFENTQMSFNDDIQKMKIEKYDFENEELIFIVIKIFLPFFKFSAASPIRHFTESEDVVFDPGIIAFSCRVFHLLPQGRINSGRV